MSTEEAQQLFIDHLPSWCCFEWCRYKGEEIVSFPNLDATIEKGRMMLDLSYCMTEAYNENVLCTVPYSKKHFQPSLLPLR